MATKTTSGDIYSREDRAYIDKEIGARLLKRMRGIVLLSKDKALRETCAGILFEATNQFLDGERQ